MRAGGWGPSSLIALEHMGGPRERRVEGTASDWREKVADLNLLAIECRPGPGAQSLSRLAGLPDDAFAHDGQITKREVRAATLAALGPLPGELLWDVALGLGLDRHRMAARRRRRRGCAPSPWSATPRAPRMAAQNAAALGVPELEVVLDEAPGGAAKLPSPDAVFLGGGLGDPRIFDACWQRAQDPAGRLVANAVTLAGEAALLALADGTAASSPGIAVSRAEPLGGRQRAFRPLMPVTQLALPRSRHDRARQPRAGGPMRCWLLLCLGLYLPGIASLPVMDRDEARFAQATRQMLESGDFLDIRFQDEARNNKPAGIYWLQAAAVAALSDCRKRRHLALSPAVACWARQAAVLLTFAFGARLVGRPRGALRRGAPCRLAGSRRRGASRQDRCRAALRRRSRRKARSAEIYRAAPARRRPLTAGRSCSGRAEGVAILVKGPVAPGLALLTARDVERSPSATRAG